MAARVKGLSELILDSRVSKRKFERETDQLLQMSEVYLSRGWDFKLVKYPFLKVHFLDGRARPVIGVVVECSDYNFLPVSVLYTDPSFRPLTYSRIPGYICGNGMRAIVNDHPLTHQPFICLQGIREYHVHPQHEDDPWDAHRNDGFNIYYAVNVARSLVRI